MTKESTASVSEGRHRIIFRVPDQLTGLEYQPTVLYVCVDRRVSAADAEVYVPVWLWQSWRRSMFQFVSANNLLHVASSLTVSRWVSE